MNKEVYSAEEVTAAGFTDGKAFWGKFKTEHKLKYLGSGLCAEAYLDKKTGMVYKVGQVKRNNAYLKYITACFELGGNNRFLPKVFGIRIVGEYMIVALEQLNEMDYSSNRNFCTGSVESACYHIAKPAPKQKGVDDEQFQEVFIKYGEKFELGKQVAADVFMELKAACYVVAASYKMTFEAKDEFSNGARFDMHRGNFMTRENGDIVITDPLVDLGV